jgi:glycosyltransferase involved in cell wall biosynthesis
MRVLFLTLYPDAAASPRYRVTQFLPYLAEAGIECAAAAPMDGAAWRRLTGPERRGRAFWYHLRETPARLAQLLRGRAYDVVFLQKAIMSAYVKGLPALLRGCSRRLIYDIDDAVHLAPPHPLRPPWSLLEDRGQVQHIFGMADRVLAGNRWLQKEAEAAGGSAVFFPTVVDTEKFHPAETGPAVYRIGWMGSPATTDTLNLIGGVLHEISDAEIVLAGADAKRVDLPCARIAAWSRAEEADIVRSFSVGLMPQHDNTWTLGKCALKALLYMSCGVPCVAAPIGAVKDIIVHGENGFFAESAAEWRDALEALRDSGLRRRLGCAARETVLRDYALEKAGPRLAALIRGGGHE